MIVRLFMRKMTDEEVMAELNTDTPLNRARRVFAGETGRLEQKAMQRYEPTTIEWSSMRSRELPPSLALRFERE